MRFVITGRPGIGKSTLFFLIIEVLRKNGFKIGGIVTPEVRDKGVRLGFKVINLMTGEEAWLAKRDYNSPIKVGSYGVLVNEADLLVKKALSNALDLAEVIAIDEVGPMELKLPSFKPLLLNILNSGKPVILVTHFNLSDKDILMRLANAKKIVLTFENREQYRKTMPGEVLSKIRSISRS